MQLCTDCLHYDDRAIEHCPSCGGNEFAHATKKGDVVSVPAGAGMPCQNCFEVDRDLKLRYYRRALGMIFAARMWGEAGYFCASCRRKRFGFNFGFTMLLGWWGILSLFFYNPYAILVDLWALFAPPFGAGRLGAMNVNEIRAEAAADAEDQQRLADVYMQMPGWFESLEDEEIDLILAGDDYYAALGATRTATHVEIKAAWRDQVKRHHPDTAGAASHARMIAINQAYKVLGDERLRHAYDNREELLSFLGAVDAYERGGADDHGFAYGCEVCRIGFDSFDEAADHCDAIHPHSDYADVLVRLDGDDEDAHTPSNTASDDASAGWRCKACGQVFPEYDAALVHADESHPERHVVDIRAAVERA